jgi:ferredoxin
MYKKFWYTLLKPSTVAFLREGWEKPGYTWFDGLHGYVYGRWPYLYISIGTGEHRLAKFLGPLYREVSQMLAALASVEYGVDGGSNGSEIEEQRGKLNFADSYHGKVMPLDSASRLVLVNEDIRIADLEKVIPYAKAREIVLRNPDHILALECPCRSARKNPCLPLDVCLVIGEPFVSFVAEHHPRRSRWISQEEAVEVLRAEDQRGHVHHAFFKDAMFGRYYAICNCCACCCGAMQAHRGGTPMLASSGYVCEVDLAACIGCGECETYCQFGALSQDSYTAQVDVSRCMGCGVCVSKCEQGALSLRRDGAKGIPLEVAELFSMA